MMLVDNQLDLLVYILENGNRSNVDAVAYQTGWLNPRGSFFDSNPWRLPTRAERCEGIIASNCRLYECLQPPEPPRAHPALSSWVPLWYRALTPRDYPGLGGQPRFSIAELRVQCAHVAGAAESALLCALLTAERLVQCQALGCAEMLTLDMGLACRVCAVCMMGVYCPSCAARQAVPALCRICLRFAVVTSLPRRWIADRRHRLDKLLANSDVVSAPGADADVCEVMLQLLAPHAAQAMFLPSRAWL